MMKTSLLLLVLALAFVSAQDASPESSDVLVLNAENFQSALESNKLIAVEFYAPWCGHCKTLAPEWESAATSLKGKVALAKVDCTVDEKLCGDHEVTGFPTLKLFREGERSDLQVARKAEAIVSYLNAELQPSTTILNSQADIDAFLAANKMAMIGYFENDKDERFTLFSKLAAKLRHSFSFGAVHNSEVASDKTRPTLVLHRPFDEPTVVYKGEFDAQSLDKFALFEKLPLLGEINGDTYNGYLATELPLGYLFVDPDADNTATFDVVRKIAKDIKDKLILVWIDNKKYAQHGVRLGLSGKVVPSFIVDDTKKGSRFKFSEESPIADLAKWIGDYISGTIAPHIKSEEIPANNEGPVKTVVALNFEEIVNDATKDVLVEFYAPWCGHCQKLAPVWEELADAYKTSSKVVIAKIDATANDVPGSLNIRGFPTIFLFPAADKKSPLLYEGPRELADFKKFLRQHSEGLEETETEETKETKEAEKHDEL